MAKLNGVKTIDMVNGEITKVAYEGAEYTKVVSAEVGDLALCTDDISYFTKGEYYEVIEVDNDGDVHAIDDEGDRFHMYVADGECALFRKISAQSKPTLEQRVGALESDVAALKGEKVAEESKRLTVGDIAKIIGHESGHFGEIGDIVKIVADDKDDQPYQCERISDGRDVGWFYEEDLVAYNEETIEFEGATYRKVDREAREGDVVIIRVDTSGHVPKDTPFKVTGGEGKSAEIGDLAWVYSIRKDRTRETVDVYEPIEQGTKVASEPKLKAGDYVKFKRSISDTKANKPYLIEYYAERGELAFRDDAGDWCSIAHTGEYEILSAEEAKWAKIGRKPNEFKIGDIVEVTGSCMGHSVGTIGEVVKAPPHFIGTGIGVKANGNIKSHLGQMKLVAPVESLFNA